MVGKTKAANKTERDRMERIKLYTGCLPSLILGRPNGHCEVHHVLSGGPQDRHTHTYGVSQWHHRGVCEGSTAGMYNALGPSMARDPKDYRLAFGPERILLETQEFALEMYEDMPWGVMEMPPEVAREIREYHMENYPASHYATLKWGGGI